MEIPVSKKKIRRRPSDYEKIQELIEDFQLLDASRQRSDFTSTDTWRVFRILSEFVQGFETMSKVGPGVVIFGSARTPRSSPWYAQARECAAILARKGVAVITGGGPGIMEAANRGARETGGHSVGLNIELPHEQKPNQYIDTLLSFHYFFVRKMMFVKYALGFIIFPGGYGTLDELFESLTLVQTLRVRDFGIVLVGKKYWQGVHRWLKSKVLAEGCISEAELDLVRVTDDPEQAVDIVLEHLENIADRGPDGKGPYCYRDRSLRNNPR
jgi:uncharacterized protein (TIGR00730 family)